MLHDIFFYKRPPLKIKRRPSGRLFIIDRFPIRKAHLAGRLLLFPLPHTQNLHQSEHYPSGQAHAEQNCHQS